MTIIEKIEHYSNDADFALVLYTACDHGRGVHETEIPAKNRARQNVVFEHGYLMAKLGTRTFVPWSRATSKSQTTSAELSTSVSRRYGDPLLSLIWGPTHGGL
jgi:hypothetical protein